MGKSPKVWTEKGFYVCLYATQLINPVRRSIDVARERWNGSQDIKQLLILEFVYLMEERMQGGKGKGTVLQGC